MTMRHRIVVWLDVDADGMQRAFTALDALADPPHLLVTHLQTTSYVSDTPLGQYVPPAEALPAPPTRDAGLSRPLHSGASAPALGTGES